MSAGPSHPDKAAIATRWDRGSGMEPDPTLSPLTRHCHGLMLSAQCERHGTLGLGLDDCSCRSKDVFISLPCLETITNVDFSSTGERWMFILPMWFLLSCLSWPAHPSYFWGALIIKAPLLLLPCWVASGRRRTCLGKLCSSSKSEWQRKGPMVLVPVVITNKGKDHMAFHTSSVPFSNMHKRDCVNRARASACVRSRLDFLWLVNVVCWVGCIC